MNRIKIGINVDIKRSDGRIHAAQIVEQSKNSRTVTVEWFENGETKGKEIDIFQILPMNVNLISPDGDENSSSSPKKERKTMPNMKKMLNGVSVEAPTIRAIAEIKEHSEGEENVSPNLGNQDMATASAVLNRKLTTVQEIEKLQKNRAYRRAQQEEMKRHKEKLKNVDQGNPNWQFLSMIRDYRNLCEFRPLKITDPVVDNKILVCIRKRPLNRNEINLKEIEVVTIPNKNHVVAHQPQTKVDLTKYLDNQKFRFDYVFDENANNEMVYRFTAQPLVKTVFEQGFATCFAYGQTGSGKTHTMVGELKGKMQDASHGIYALTTRDIFRTLEIKDFRKEGLLVACSFFEIYSGKVFDLLRNKAKLSILEDGKKEVQIVGLEEKTVANEHEVLELIQKGAEFRTAGQTSVNNHSSRSHAVFQIVLRKRINRKLFGKFSLIDLAGNERGVDTMSSDRQTRMESAEINKSLLALKECIRAMGRNSGHVPFRASKLTMVLRDSFLGTHARTCMIAMISPGMNSCEHTLNTLRYGNRVKELGADDDFSPNNVNRVDIRMNSNSALNEIDSDLALLQSANGEEFSKEAYNFNLTVDHLNAAEEIVQEEHQKLIQGLDSTLKELRKLLKKSEKVDYDMEAYARDLMAHINTFTDCSKLKGSIKKLQSEIQREAAQAQARSSKCRK